MSQIKDLKRKRRRLKTERRVRTVAILVVLAMLCSGGYVYAKYFSEAARWGIAIASGVYFTANYAAESDEFFECSVTTDYSGGNYDITFEVRNYENNLLFNESNVEIPYSVSFWLGEEIADGTTYTVKEGAAGTGTALEYGETKAIEFENKSIAGGVARADKYIINIVVPADVTHTPVPIYVLVQTSEGATISKTLRGKMVLTDKVSYDSCYIVSQGFMIPDSTADEFAYMSKLSMFSYETRTAGELTGGDSTEQLKLSWNPDVFEIDLFDDAYQEWLSSDAYNALVAAGTVLDANGIPTDSTGNKYILMEVVPYSAQTVGFFRGSAFSAENSAITDMDALNAAIEAEIYTETSN